MSPANHGPRPAAALVRARRMPVLLVMSLLAMPIAPAAAQQTGPGVQQSSFDRSSPAVRFARQSPEIGDQIDQTILVELRMTTMERRDMEVLDQTHSVMRSEQHRVITTSDVADGLATGVKLRYMTATRQMGRSQDSSEPDVNQAPPERQPVDGKVYECHRAGDALIVTDARGGIPPMDEYEVVAQHMEMLGRASPLADFLTGRTVYVGQRVSLPSEVAERLLGMGGQLGKVTRFDLTLTGVATEQGSACAVFQADVEAVSNDSSQMRLQVSGPMVVETNTCRAVRVELTGPIGTSETRGSYSTKYYLIGTGSMAVSLRSAYRDVAR